MRSSSFLELQGENVEHYRKINSEFLDKIEKPYVNKD